MSQQYVYIYLDNRKPGKWEYKGLIFNYQPFYVGIGKGDRIREHLHAKVRRKISIKSHIINKIFAEKGVEPIHFKIYEDLTIEEAKLIEIDMIAYFGRIHLGTGILANMTPGGETMSEIIQSQESIEKRAKAAENIIHPRSKIILKKDEEGNIIETFHSVSLAARSISVNPDKILRASLRKTLLQGFFWEKTEETAYVQKDDLHPSHEGKAVFQYDLDGNFVREYKNAPEAYRITGIGAPSICKGCNEERTKVNGFMWFYKFQGPKIDPYVPFQKAWHRSVVQFDLEGRPIKTWKHMTQIAKTLKLNEKKLSKACKQFISYNGFNWRFVQDCALPSNFGRGTLKEVYQYSLDGFFISRFDSAVEAAKIVTPWGKNQNRSISACCLGTIYTAYGFKWFFEFKGDVLLDESKAKGKSSAIKISEIDKDGRVIKSFNSLAHAMKETSLYSYQILKSCRLNTATPNGRLFKFD